MSLHQVRIRKDGPIHAVEFKDGEYANRTLCGFEFTGLEKPIRRRFSATSDFCGRCHVSAEKAAA